MEKEIEDIVIPVYHTNAGGQITIDEESIRELFEFKLSKILNEYENN